MNSIFISSSFKDMQHERDTIRYKTLPQINDYLRNNYGQETTVIDLRWGINTNEVDEQASMRKIVRTCLFEIDHCKPFMIVLLGDRYGTIIDKKQFNNCGEDFDLEDIDDIGVTELEVRYAMHLAKQDKMHVFFYFRNMDYSAVSESDRTNIYFDSDMYASLSKYDEASTQGEILKLFFNERRKNISVYTMQERLAQVEKNVTDVASAVQKNRIDADMQNFSLDFILPEIAWHKRTL